MITQRKTVRKTALSAVDGGGKIIDAGVEVVKNTDSVDHWKFLDEIEAPMWADLSLSDITNDEINDPWFDISHQFHQYSSSQLLSTIFHPNSTTNQEPPSPKLPPSVSKSRGKTYKTKSFGQKTKQHPVKTLTMKPITNNTKPSSNKPLKVTSSCESGITDTSLRPKVSKSSLCSLTSQEQEQEGSAMSSVTVTSICNEDQEKKGLMDVNCKRENKSNDLLSSLRNSLRRSCATRPAARVVNGRCSEGFKDSSSSSKSSIGSSSKGINVITVSQPVRNEVKVVKVTNAPLKNVGSLLKRQGSSTLGSKITSKGKVQENKSVGRVLMPQKVNEQNQMADKEGRCAPILGGIKKVVSGKISTSQKGISGKKESQLTGNVQKGCKENVGQKNGSKKLNGLKEKTNTGSKDKDTHTTRKVYFR